MSRVCHQPVRMATGDAFSDEEIDDILDRLLKKAQRRGEVFDREGLQAAAAELTKEEVLGRLAEQRLRVAAARASGKVDAQLAAMSAIGDEADRLKAYNVGSEKQGLGGSFSVDAEARARTVALWGEAERQLRDAGLMDKLSGFAVDGTLERNIRRERARLNGQAVNPTGDADALKAAEILNALSEKGRLMQNDVGAWIGKLDGYAGRQSHDRLRVSGGFWREFQAGGVGALRDFKGASLKASRRAFREWRDFIRPKLDDRTFEGIEARDVDDGWLDDAKALQAAGAIDDAADVREVMLYRVWFDIVSGKSEVLGGMDDIGDFRPPSSKARSVSKHRVLHFATPDDAHDYALRFGRGSLLANAMGELERAARNTALMNRWGPAPEAMFENKVGVLHAQARARGDAGAANRLMRAQRRAEFDELTGAGNQPDSLRLAMIGRSIRLQQSLAKLGGMVLSGLSDTSLSATAMKRAGATWLDGYNGALQGVSRLQGAEGKAAADLLDVGARSAAAHLTGRFHAPDGPLGWAAQAQRFFYRINLFEFWQDGLRRGVAEMYARHLGAEAARPWAQMSAGTRETLERYGLDAADWDLVRRGLLEPEAPREGYRTLRQRADAADVSEPEGRRYFTFEAVDGISDRDLLKRAGLTGKQAQGSAGAEAARRLREDLRVRLQAMVQGVLDDAMTEARARERVAMTRGVRPGTVWGESVRAFTQFWSFSAAIMGRHVAPASRGYAGQAPVALLAHLILASTALGYLSLQAKQITKGREPRPIFDEDGAFQGGELFMASLLQGGGLGIYGDFLFGEASRNGMPATLSAFAGPSVSEAEKLRGILADVISGDPERLEDVPAAGFRFAKDNTPFLNLFYTRTALDYLILYRIQEAISPGSVARYEKRVEEGTGAGFILSPSEAVE